MRTVGRRRRPAIALLLALTVVACHESKDYSPTAPEFQNSLTLTASSTSVIADGTSTVDLVVKIDPGAKADLRRIVLKTSAGTLITADAAGTATTTGSTVTVVVDTTGEARAKLRSSTDAGTRAEVTAQVENLASLIKRVFVDFIRVEDGLVLTAATSALPADGFSLADLSARVALGGDPAARKVVFITSIGTLVGAGSVAEDGRQLTVNVTSDGLARAQLKSEKTVGTAFVRAEVEGLPQISDALTVDFRPVDPEEILRLSAARATADADGASRIQIYADVSPSLPSGQRTVTFKSELGTFAGTASLQTTMDTADAGNRATATLVAPLVVGLDRITAEVSGVSSHVGVDFVRAFPDQIVVDPGDTQLQASFADSTVVTATLVRVNLPGDVTLNTPVVFKAVDPATETDLRLTFTGNNLSMSGGKVMVTLTAGDTAYRGPARIDATVEGTGVVGSGVIQIVDPPPTT